MTKNKESLQRVLDDVESERTGQRLGIGLTEAVLRVALAVENMVEVIAPSVPDLSQTLKAFLEWKSGGPR